MKQPNANTQYLGALMVAFPGFLYGMMIGWSSPAIFLLTSNQTPLSTGPITMEQASWITSLKSGGMVFGCFLTGTLARKFGRKWPLIFLSIPSLTGWFLIYFAKHIYYLYAARVIQGFVVAGTFTFGHLYLVEISNDSLRGALTSSLMLAANCGILAAFAIGTYFSYYACPLFAIVVNVLFVILFAMFPETALFLLKKNKIKEAEKSIQFLQNIDPNDRNLIDMEIEKINLQIQSTSTSEMSTKCSDITDSIIKNPGKKALIIGTVLALLNHVSGNFALVSYPPPFIFVFRVTISVTVSLFLCRYTANIFEEAGSVLHPNISALIVALAQFFGACLIPFFVERCGRKLLYITSTALGALGLAILGLFIMLKVWHYNVQSFTWVPIVAISATIFIQAIAVANLSFTVTTEILPDNLREFGTSFCNVVLSMSAFIVLKFMPLLTETIGLHGAMFLFAGFSIAGTLFVVLYMPETKGKSYKEIMKSLQ